MLNIYDLDQQQVANELLRNKILAAVRNNQIIIMGGKVEQAQSVIDRMYYGMPDLLSVQFYFLLAKSGLDIAINTLLTALQSEDLNKYAMYTDIKDKILLVDDTLDFTEQQLKDMWNEAKTI